MYLQPGNYAICDPTYLDDIVIPESMMGLGYQNKSGKKIIQINGQRCYIFATAYGSGTYNILKNRRKYVTNHIQNTIDTDSGSIIVIPQVFIKAGFSKYAVDSTGLTISIDKPTEIIHTAQKNIIIGPYMVDTSDHSNPAYASYMNMDGKKNNMRVARKMTMYMLLKIMYDEQNTK